MHIILQRGMQRFEILERSKIDGEIHFPQFHDYASALSFLNPAMHEPQSMQAIRKFISNTLFIGTISRLCDQQVLEQFARELLRGCYHFRRLPFFGQSSAGAPAAFATAEDSQIVRSKTIQQRIQEPAQLSKREQNQPQVHKQVQSLKSEPVQPMVQETVQPVPPLLVSPPLKENVVSNIETYNKQIHIALVDDEGNPIPHEPFKVISNGNLVTEGNLNEEGLSSIILPEGNYKIFFPERDAAWWENDA